jgi:DNA-binding response OmpR family regulator
MADESDGGGQRLFSRTRILVVEDDPLTALDLAATVRDTGGTVIGPVASVEEALEILDAIEVDAAILDVNLSDGCAFRRSRPGIPI